MRAFIFPGQGSQVVGMGREVYEAFRCAKDVFQEVDETLGQNLTKLIFEGPDSELALTENTQPALMTVSMAFMRVLEKEGGLTLSPNDTVVAGHSLGQYSAMCAAGSLTLSDTARLLRIRGKAMQQAVPVGQGAMAAVLGLEIRVIEKIIEEAAQDQVCELANDNCPGQVVISGNKEAVERAVELAKEAGAKRSLLLNVSAPFHCGLMMPAQERMAEALSQVIVKAPFVPVIDNVTAKAQDEGETLRECLVSQVCGRVRWRESVEEMAQSGVVQTIEVGAGKVLTGLSKRISPTIDAIALNTPQDFETYLSQTEAA